IAAVRWLRGDVSQIVVLDTLGRIEQVVSSGHSIEATPSWTADDSGILYSSDRSGTAQIYAHRTDGSTVQLTQVRTGIFEPQAAESRMAAVTFASNGYHLAVGAPHDMTPVAAYIDSAPAPNTAPVVADSGPVLAYS